MGLASRIRVTRPTTPQLIISLLIAGLGWISGQALSQIDEDLRIIHTEYTLGAADIAHISADAMRYRNVIIRSLEAELFFYGAVFGFTPSDPIAPIAIDNLGQRS